MRLFIAISAKNYKDTLIRNDGRTIENYTFAAEREWRYVLVGEKAEEVVDLPIVSLKGLQWDDSTKKHLNENLKKKELAFTPDDIKYIIVKDDNDIKEILDHIKNTKGKNYSYEAITRLQTRIITCEQIKNDF